MDPSLIQQSATHYAYVAQDGTVSRGAVFVDYKGREEISPNIVIVRNIDVDRYKMMLMSTIGGTSSALVERVLKKRNN
jgi:inosine-uridine nucleoside N-ribohydrolase